MRGKHLIRKFVFFGLLAVVFGLAVASAQEISPTANGPEQLVSTVGTLNTDGTQSAAVTQTVNVNVPPATALHSTADNLTFDISKIGTDQGTDWWCVQGPASGAPGTLDPATGDYLYGPLSANYYGQTQVLPMGTYYDPTTWPKVTIHGDHITQYPPGQLDSNSVLVSGSKEYFVCYRTFILQSFSNFSHYDLQVQRADNSNQPYPEPIYIQGNTFCSYAADQPTGLFALPADGSGTAHLIPAPIGTGPTGAAAEACGQTDYQSWLKNLVVVAVKIDGEHYGTSTTTLTYTLVSADSALN
ncbi:MAG: hypothetical protein P8Y13_06240 [Deinococcales bacterium]